MTFRLLLTCVFLTCTAGAAMAVSADLAKRCRAMTIKAYPPVVAGSKKGDAQEERNYFSTCISKNGRMDAESPKTPKNN